MGIFLSAVFGLVAGSFLNVCIWRLPREKSIVWPGSGCPACGTPIKFYDNIPLLSFILLGGRCRKCRAPISRRYPLVEALTAALTTAFLLRPYPVVWLAAGLLAVYAIIVLSFIDMEFFIIPDELSLGLLGLGIAVFWANPNFTGSVLSKLGQALGGGAAGFGLMWLLAVAGEKLFGKEAMGGGDLKLMAGVGSLVGWQGMLSTLLIGSFFGSVYGLSLLLLKKAGRADPIPFGPFLGMAAAINLYKLIPLSAFIL